MTMLKLTKIAAELIKDGKTDSEIRAHLFNVKGARLLQIQKVMDLISA